MIKLLGFRRTLILGVMLALNALLATVYFLWASPETQSLTMQLNGLRNQISTLQQNIQNTKADMKFLQENISTYDDYLAKGLFQEQDRFGMSRALESLKARARIQGFSFSVGDIKEVQNGNAQMAEKRLLHSRVTVERISSALDINFFDLMDLIEKEFPGHARIQTFDLSRPGALTPEMMQRIGQEPFSLITAKLTFDWLTLGELQRPDGSTPATPGGF